MGLRKTKRKYSRESKKQTTPSELELTMTEMFERFIWYKETEGLASRTIQDYYTHFSYLIDYLEGDLLHEEMDLEVFRGWIGYMLHDKGLSPVTVNVRVRTIRAFLRYSYLEQFISYPIHERFKPVKTEKDTLQSLTPAEVKVLFNTIDDSTFVGFRDKTMLLVLLDTMVRISELLQMKRTNVDVRNGSIKLEAQGTKTKSSRVVPLSTKTLKFVQDYLSESDDFGEDLLFLTYDGRPLTSNTWRKRLTEYGEQAGIKNKRVSPHTFRHTGALLYIMNGGDPFSLQNILGHSDMSMVRKYIQMTNTDVKTQHNHYSPLKGLFNSKRTAD